MQERTSILFENVNEDETNDISFYLENDDGHIVDIRSETLTFTVMFMKI